MINNVAKRLHIHVLVSGAYASVESMEQASLASTRMRSALVARAAVGLEWNLSIGERFDQQPDLIYIGKIGAERIRERSHQWTEYIKHLKNKGSTILLDYTDHHCGFPSVMTEFYGRSTTLADVLIVPSASMATLVSPWASVPPVVVPDPLEVERSPPRLPTPAPWRALWFGSQSNIDFLSQFILRPDTCRWISEFNVVTNASGAKIFTTWISGLQRDFSGLRFRFFDWSLSNLRLAADQSDIAVIPSDATDVRKIGVSENRLATAITLGLPTLATLLPAYRPYKNFFGDLDKDPFIFLNKNDIVEILTNAQDVLQAKLSRETVLNKWVALLNESRPRT